MRATPEQQACIEFPTLQSGTAGSVGNTLPQHLLIEAGAGAGKTAVLARRVLWKVHHAPLGHRLRPEQIVLATFTRAAEKELRERVRGLFAESQEENLVQAASLVQISTIDGLLMSLLMCHFPDFWSQAFTSGQDAFTRKTSGLCPEPELLDEDQAIQQLEDSLGPHLQDILSELAHHAPLKRASWLDFLVSGALHAAPYADLEQSPTGSRGIRKEVLKYLTSEACLLLSQPQTELIQETLHPATRSVLRSLEDLGRHQHARRLQRGQITHTDRLVFLHNLYCATQEQKQGTPYEGQSATLPVPFQELIVDEYQDTNPIQHELLFELVRQARARMIVVGDPKQSLYGFRRAKVSLFNSLKKQQDWVRIELSKNFRSDPALLHELNQLSSRALSFQNKKIPDTFWQSSHGQAALLCQVEACDLDAGREVSAFTIDSHPPHSEEGFHARVVVLTHSLNAKRYAVPPDSNWPEGVQRKDLGIQLVLEAISKELAQGRSASACVVLTESNKDCAEIAQHLGAAGIQAHLGKGGASSPLALPSRSLRYCRALSTLLLSTQDSMFWRHRIAIFDLFLALGLSLENAAECTHRIRHRLFVPDKVKSPPSPSLGSSGVLEALTAHLLACRQVARHNPVAAWILLLRGWIALAPRSRSLTELMPEILVWGARFSHLDKQKSWLEDCTRGFPLQSGWNVPIPESIWNFNPEKELATQTAPQESVAVLTVHGAKGLQWPCVFFVPKMSEQGQQDHFRYLEFSDRTVAQWLPDRNSPLEAFARVHAKSQGHDLATSIPIVDSITPDMACNNEETLNMLKLQEGAEKSFERSRVFYTAITRAEEKLYLFAGKGDNRRRNSIRDVLNDFTDLDSCEKRDNKLNGLTNYVYGGYLDEIFRLRSTLPDGKKRGKTPQEPWFSAEFAHRQPTHKDRPVVYRDAAAPSLAQRLRHMQHAKGPPAHRENKQTEQRAALKDVAQQTAPLSGEAVREETEHWLHPLDNRDAESGTLGEGGENNSEQRNAPQESEMRSSAEAGLLFHAERELSEPKTALRDPLIDLVQACAWSEREFEIWTPQNTDLQKRGGWIQHPARHILDFIGFCPRAQLPDSLDLKESSMRPLANSRRSDQPHAEDAPHWIVVVADYKTGAQKKEHLAQMERYLEATTGYLQNNQDPIPAHARISLVGLLCYVRSRDLNGKSTSLGTAPFQIVQLTSSSHLEKISSEEQTENC